MPVTFPGVVYKREKRIIIHAEVRMFGRWFVTRGKTPEAAFAELKRVILSWLGDSWHFQI